MAFIDELTIYAKAGDGGGGVVRWRHEKGIELGGPAGGDGGRGGHVYAKAVRDVHLLARYRAIKEFAAERGENGGKKSLHGANGKDLDILFPIGSIITNKKTGQQISLYEEGERVLLLSGGQGGRGNESFKSSVNRSPQKATPGKPGEDAEFYIEVELIADIGLIGFPNAGKTSILNALSNARGKVGDYPFTTLEPNLGECFGYIIADVPGLVEGAAEGKGLGHKFLRHIRRTKILVHLVSLENDDLLAAYKTVRKELKQFDPVLLEKKEIVVITKTDITHDVARLKKDIQKLKKLAPIVTTVSLYDDKDVQALQKIILKEAAEKDVL
ncbi:MAG: GTPase ObgE [Parcubacteria group bacterium]|nr:GTPase ObgE [Parcubacteria group bacterium]